ncbi:MAG: rhodanese-like domain-containing protein [Methylotenera sp.]|nr:rhodanese-like domain-containing protein [Oligoflexia bacterium]
MNKIGFLFVTSVTLALGISASANSTGNSGNTVKTTCADEAHYPLITKAELKDVAAKKAAFIVDVNSEESFKKVHVPGAIHFAANEKEFTQVLPKDKNTMIVSYCGGVQCSAWKKAAQEACNLGYTNIRHFKEGIQGWTASN